MQEWREDIKTLLIESGGEAKATSFVFTDSQIKEDGFLEDINNLLNTGEVPNIFPPDEKSDVTEKVRNEAKSQNKAPEGTPAQLFQFFIDQCKAHLHIVLCFSPIGDNFRNRVRNFPSLVNCTTIDWFSEWPSDALDSVAKMFLEEVDIGSEIKAHCIAMVKLFHTQTTNMAETFLEKLNRHYYVTPTSYLEMITTFKNLLKEKRKEVSDIRDRYENGYDCLIKTEDKVSDLQ